MRILLVNPPYPYSEVPIMPLGLAYIGAVLERNGDEVEILDLLMSRYSKDKVRQKLEEYQPDIVGVTSVTLNYPIASDILKYCKSLNKDITTIIGGPHVTFLAAETLDEAPWIDIVVRGEGEQTILDIVNRKKLEHIDGIAFRSEDGIEITPDRGFISDLDALPSPALHLYPISRYRAFKAPWSLISGRGCPFGCIFCVGSKMVGKKTRYRSPKLVVDEMEKGLAYGFDEIHLEDDLLTLNHKHLYAVCDEILNRGLKFNWSAFSRVDTINPDVLRKMREAGCTGMLYGIESGNQHILDKIKKKITLEKIKEAVEMAREAGITVLASFIIGLPGETQETLDRSIEFALELNTYFGFHVLAPFPGTEVREKAEEYGIEILTNDWSKYDANRAVCRTEGAGPAEIKATLHRYYRGIRITQEALEGIMTAQQEREEREKRRSPLVWSILRGDVIESLGMVERDGDPVAVLSRKVAETVPYSQDQVRENIESWVGMDLLKYDMKGEHLIWRWS